MQYNAVIHYTSTYKLCTAIVLIHHLSEYYNIKYTSTYNAFKLEYL